MTKERLWVSDDGMAWYCHPKSCVFCDNCTDVFYDYTHGPYMCICDKGLPQKVGAKGQCEQFEEENPDVVTEEEYKKMRKETQELINKLKETDIYEKVCKAYMDMVIYGKAVIDGKTYIVNTCNTNKEET